MFTIKDLMRVVMMLVVAIIIATLSHHAEAKTKGVPYPAVIGSTDDGKYPVYLLKGELADVNYFSENTIYTSGDLLTRMVFIEPQDVNHGYVCDYVCKDKYGHIVGLNPAYKFLLKE